jgi:N-acetylmuramoyl-L-alanine amidase
MIFNSAGHNPKGIKVDPGASGFGYNEAHLACMQRDAVNAELDKKNVKYISDKDDETLADYLKRIQTGEGSVVLEYHFDAFNGKASGATALVGSDADRLDKMFAKELVDTTSTILGIPNRGVKSESESHRGRLGLMREQGTVSLIELCFIDNKADLDKWFANYGKLAKAYADILIKYENLV